MTIYLKIQKTDDVRPDISKFTQPKFLKGDSPLKNLKRYHSWIGNTLSKSLS